MTRHVWLVCVVPLAATASLALAQCSSASSPPATGNSSGSNASSGSGVASGSSSGSGVTSGSSSGAGEGGSSGEGGASSGSTPSCTSVDGGAQCSDPGVVSCAGATCDVSTHYCCVEQASADAGRTETCVAPNGACSSNAKISCNEAADCTGGALCCGSFPMTGVQGVTSCMASCSGGQGVQLCRSDSECGANSDAGADLKKCVTQTCGGTTLQLCAVPASRFADAGNGGAYAGCTAR